MVDREQRRLLVLCAARVGGKSLDWNVLAREAMRHDGLSTLYAGTVRETSSAAAETARLLVRALEDLPPAERRVDDELAVASDVGARLITVLDDTYPANLRLIPDLPPFLFVRGDITDADAKAVAVVGTREASKEGLRHAATMARLLSARDVTVVSGLARGIDTEAHRAALDAGGRTIAVLGTGVARCYPPENRALGEAVVQRGALVSQFWPTSPPAAWTFPRRNVVMSGISQGTAVIEASSTSGAKMQARLALQHGKKVWLLDALVTSQKWAQDYVESRGAVKVSDVDDVVKSLAAPERVIQASRKGRQLTLELR